MGFFEFLSKGSAAAAFQATPGTVLRYGGIFGMLSVLLLLAALIAVIVAFSSKTRRLVASVVALLGAVLQMGVLSLGAYLGYLSVLNTIENSPTAPTPAELASGAQQILDSTALPGTAGFALGLCALIAMLMSGPQGKQG